MKNKFWRKALNCNHEWSDYEYTKKCTGAEQCILRELRCIKCGMYDVTCDCGFSNRLSGEPIKKSLRRERKKRYDSKNQIHIKDILITYNEDSDANIRFSIEDKTGKIFELYKDILPNNAVQYVKDNFPGVVYFEEYSYD